MATNLNLIKYIKETESPRRRLALRNSLARTLRKWRLDWPLDGRTVCGLCVFNARVREELEFDMGFISCDFCPVVQKGEGEFGCKGTPFSAYAIHFQVCKITVKDQCVTCFRLKQDELDFLRWLAKRYPKLGDQSGS